jgi:hypothetical protein
LRQHGVALACIADPPDAGAGGAERGLDEERIGPWTRKVGRRVHDGRVRLRHVQVCQQFGETGLALHLFERLEIRQRNGKPGWQSRPCRGKQIGLLMHRQQHLDRTLSDDVQHSCKVAVRIGARGRHRVHPIDETREAPEASGIAGDDLEAVAGEAKRCDRLARGQAGAFAEQDFWLLRAHSMAVG